MAYNIFPAVDESHNFPPVVRAAMAASPEVQAAINAGIPSNPGSGTSNVDRVNVSTGLEVRPSVAFVIWVGGTSRPANMAEGDVWFAAGAITPASPPTVVTSSFNSMVVGSAFSQTMAATGVGPITWSATSLPAGLSLSSSGVLSGTPTTVSSGTATITATNAGGPTNRNIAWTVTASATAPTILTSPAPPAGQTGVVYSWSPGRSGSTPMGWGVSSGALPTGLSINSSTGAVSGTPTVAGSYAFQLQATNSAGTDTESFNISVAATPTDIATIFGGTAPAEPLSYSDADAGSWLAQQFYCPVTGDSMENGEIIGARLYVPAGSAHIGQTWRAALNRYPSEILTSASSPGQSAFDSNGTLTEGSVLIAGWNEITFASEWPAVDNGGSFLIGIQIGTGTRYLHDASTVATTEIFAQNGANLVLAPLDKRCWYRGTYVSARWYGIDVKVRKP